MHVIVRVRIFLTRHRWAYWVVVVSIAGSVGWFVQQQVDALERARSSWGEARTVLIATTDLMPDGPIRVSPTEVPVALIPPGAISEIEPEDRIHQRVMAGEMLTAADLIAATGPSAHADPGTVVVGLADPLARNASVGLTVRVASEGIVLAEHATIVAVVDEVIFVAVDDTAGPSVAAAAQMGSASLIFVP